MKTITITIHVPDDVTVSIKTTKTSNVLLYAVGPKNGSMLYGPTPEFQEVVDYIPNSNIQESIYLFEIEDGEPTPTHNWSKSGKKWNRIKTI